MMLALCVERESDGNFIIERGRRAFRKVWPDSEDDFIGARCKVDADRFGRATIAVGLLLGYEPARFAVECVKAERESCGRHAACDVEHVGGQPRHSFAPAEIQRPRVARSASVMFVALPSGIAWLATACT